MTPASSPLPTATEVAVAIHAKKHALPPPLVRAMVCVESAGDSFAWNPEPQYRYLWDVARRAPFRALKPAEIASEIPPTDFPVLIGDRDAEWWGQQASWGLMQVMGAVAREHGFTGHLPGLCDSFKGLEYGCQHLAALRDRYLKLHGWPGVVCAYNAGSPRLDAAGHFVNQIYADKVARQGGFVGV